jgi:RNA polymerase sigma-70 factor (ECF subfamily)
MNTELRAGEAGFRAWYQRTSPRLYAYVRRYCAEGDCDDVIAEVYLIAWRRVDQVPADSVPWLIGTARNVLANTWRARDRRHRLVADLATLSALAAPDLAGQAVERADLLGAVARLDPSDQEVLLLVGWDGLDTAGLATALGCSPSAARARLSRARRRLAAGLATPTDNPTALLQLVPEGN